MKNRRPEMTYDIKTGPRAVSRTTQLLGAAAAFGLLMLLVGLVRAAHQPAPAPVATVSATPSSSATPTPTPILTPVPVAKPVPAPTAAQALAVAHQALVAWTTPDAKARTKGLSAVCLPGSVPVLAAHPGAPLQVAGQPTITVAGPKAVVIQPVKGHRYEVTLVAQGSAWRVATIIVR